MKEEEEETESFLLCFCCLFLTVCYSDHQGQASAKRQGKFKKVLDELETTTERPPLSYQQEMAYCLPSDGICYILINYVKACHH